MSSHSVPKERPSSPSISDVNGPNPPDKSVKAKIANLNPVSSESPLSNAVSSQEAAKLIAKQAAKKATVLSAIRELDLSPEEQKTLLTASQVLSHDAILIDSDHGLWFGFEKDETQDVQSSGLPHFSLTCYSMGMTVAESIEDYISNTADNLNGPHAQAQKQLENYWEKVRSQPVTRESLLELGFMETAIPDTLALPQEAKLFLLPMQVDGEPASAYWFEGYSPEQMLSWAQTEPNPLVATGYPYYLPPRFPFPADSAEPLTQSIDLAPDMQVITPPNKRAYYSQHQLKETNLFVPFSEGSPSAFVYKIAADPTHNTLETWFVWDTALSLSDNIEFSKEMDAKYSTPTLTVMPALKTAMGIAALDIQPFAFKPSALDAEEPLSADDFDSSFNANQLAMIDATELTGAELEPYKAQLAEGQQIFSILKTESEDGAAQARYGLWIPDFTLNQMQALPLAPDENRLSSEETYSLIRSIITQRVEESVELPLVQEEMVMKSTTSGFKLGDKGYTGLHTETGDTPDVTALLERDRTQRELRDLQEQGLSKEEITQRLQAKQTASMQAFLQELEQDDDASWERASSISTPELRSDIVENLRSADPSSHPGIYFAQQAIKDPSSFISAKDLAAKLAEQAAEQRKLRIEAEVKRAEQEKSPVAKSSISFGPKASTSKDSSPLPAPSTRLSSLIKKPAPTDGSESDYGEDEFDTDTGFKTPDQTLWLKTKSPQPKAMTSATATAQDISAGYGRAEPPPARTDTRTGRTFPPDIAPILVDEDDPALAQAKEAESQKRAAKTAESLLSELSLKKTPMPTPAVEPETATKITKEKAQDSSAKPKDRTERSQRRREMRKTEGSEKPMSSDELKQLVLSRSVKVVVPPEEALKKPTFAVLSAEELEALKGQQLYFAVKPKATAMLVDTTDGERPTLDGDEYWANRDRQAAERKARAETRRKKREEAEKTKKQ